MVEIDVFPRFSEIESERVLLPTHCNVLSTAQDLYSRNLNVFPVHRPEEIRLLATLYPDKYSIGEKRPFILSPLFISRMHICSKTCFDRVKRSGRKCRGNVPGLSFSDLFYKANLGVMLGRTSNNLVCIDCDSNTAFDSVFNEMVRKDRMFWAYKTSRGGNLLFQVEQEIINSPKKIQSDIEIWTSKHFCVLPPSIHNSGVIYTWIDKYNPFSELWVTGKIPRNSINDLEWLGFHNDQRLSKVDKSISIPIWAELLSLQNQRILSEGLFQGSRNSQLVKPLYEIAALINKGLVSEQDGLTVLHQAADRANPPYGRSKVDQMLKSALRKEDLTISRNYFYSSNSSYKQIIDILHFANVYNWNRHGRTALTDKAVFEACSARFYMDHGQPFRASIREVSILANISGTKTTSRALKRLINHHLIQPVDKTTGGAQRYSFTSGVTSPSDYSNTTCSTSVVTRRNHFNDDQVRQDLLDDIFGKIGRVSRRCWQHLIENPEMNIIAIVRNTGLHYQSVYKILPKLIKLGLVSKSTSEGVFIGEKTGNLELLGIADFLGVTGKTKERREYFKIEREIRVNQLIMKARNTIEEMKTILEKG
jgi:hypothetical protein